VSEWGWQNPQGQIIYTPYSIDLPLWFDKGHIEKGWPGQSAIWIEPGPVAFGFSTENQWWGPGIRNALILSTNAAGFPHAFVRTAHPIRTGIGDFEGTFLFGSLQESSQFTYDTTDNRRSISGAIVTYRPSGMPGLELGLARIVLKSLTETESHVSRVFDVFTSVGRPNALPLTDVTKIPGKDQLASLFFRYVQPADGIEVYGEFGRAEEPINLRDLLVDPNHSLGSTLGLQWVRPVGDGTLVRIQAERSFLEQSPTYTHRPMGSWYTSRAVAQGFTNDGKVLGAAIGPGSSSQWVALDVIRPSWQIGSYFGRHRFNADAFFTLPWNLGSQGYCEFDTSLYPGIRGAVRARGNEVTWDVTYLTRLNIGFQYDSGCPWRPGLVAHDQRSWSIAFSWWPATRK
jgi:hypothetical protein